MTILIITDINKIKPVKGTNIDLLLIDDKVKTDWDKNKDIQTAIIPMVKTDGKIIFFTNGSFIIN